MYSDDLTGTTTWNSYVTKPIGANVPQKELNGQGRPTAEQISYIQKLQLDDVGGTDLQRLDTLEMPSHNHDHNINRSGDDDCGASNTFDCGEGGGKSGVVISSSGGGESHNNTPPYYVLVYIIKL